MAVRPQGHSELSDDDIRFRLRSDDPFATPAAERDPARRLRGQLVAPVTIWTAGDRARRAGLTVSSVLVAEGEPPLMLGLVGPLSDLLAVIVDTGRWLVHVLGQDDRRLAATFAGAFPGPDAPFGDLAVGYSDFGPVLPGARTTAGCRLAGTATVGWFELVQGAIEQVDAAAGAPLAYLRGRYRRLQAD